MKSSRMGARFGTLVRDFARSAAGFLRKASDFIPIAGASWVSRKLSAYAREVGEGLDSNVVMAPVMWIMRTFTEATAIVERREEVSRVRRWQYVEDHALEALIDRPNDSYDGDALWKGTALSYVLNGNAYWLKVRNAYGEVIQLWYLPHWMVMPIYPMDGSQFISHYQYTSGYGPAQPIPRRDIVHFRFGLDPRNPRLGLSPLRTLLREIYTDDEAAEFSARILENMGVPGLVVSPKDGAVKPTPAQILQLKEEIEEGFRGDKRGRTFVMGIPTDISQFGFDPNKLMLGSLRDIAEERVCAVIGIPAAVVGFGSGLQSTKVGATMRELRRLAWVQCLIPMQKSLAKQISAQLLPDFQSHTRRFRVRFDTSDVSAFQEEDDLRAKRASTLVLSGILRVDRAQEMCGLEVDPTQKVYLRPSNGMAVGPDAPAEVPPAGADAEDDDELDGEEDGGANPDDAEDETQKMLRAIATRVGVRTNGNGSH